MTPPRKAKKIRDERIKTTEGKNVPQCLMAQNQKQDRQKN